MGTSKVRPNAPERYNAQPDKRSGPLDIGAEKRKKRAGRWRRNQKDRERKMPSHLAREG